MNNTLLYKIKWRYNRYLQKKTESFGKFINSPKLSSSDYNQTIYGESKGNDIITQHLQSDKPFLVSRLGSGELRCICNYLHFKKQNKMVVWHEQVKHEMYNYGGIFPQKGKTLKQFSKIYIEAIKEIDTLGVWFNPGENNIVNTYCKKANLIPLKAIEPYYHDDPWSRLLEGKRVLVIHPFSHSIKNQYKKRELLFKNQQILPSFKLRTIQSVMSIPGESIPYKNWTQALVSMQKEIETRNFDIAIVGAGPYGLPLGAYIKKIGKQAIHMGGATQILFGIKGRRWEEMPFFQTLINDNWVVPSTKETPKKPEVLEGACYWSKTN
ncbi:MAG: hypothetical protein JEZ14_07950 [Marinilabiliaceae bacterium]|nr:hypothetical protein [Marinilabiliaceae bacterium]